MNWYSIFYWITVGDTVKDVFQIVAIIACIGTVASIVGLFVCTSYLHESVNRYGDKTAIGEGWKVWVKTWRTAFIPLIITCVVATVITTFIPSKKDALIIIAGGAVGNLITSDSSARQIPSEAMTLLRDKIRAEIKEINAPTKEVEDTLKNKSKEELEEIIHNLKK